MQSAEQSRVIEALAEYDRVCGSQYHDARFGAAVTEIEARLLDGVPEVGPRQRGKTLIQCFELWARDLPANRRLALQAIAAFRRLGRGAPRRSPGEWQAWVDGLEAGAKIGRGQGLRLALGGLLPGSTLITSRDRESRK